jgi:hypothetical protein
MPLVVPVTVTSVNASVIGGVHDGLVVAVTGREKFAFPF